MLSKPQNPAAGNKATLVSGLLVVSILIPSREKTHENDAD